jgi:hypothetical protein
VGYRINLSDKYHFSAGGRITLPDKYNNRNILEIGDFSNSMQIKEVYFLNSETCSYKRIGRGGFGT